MSQFEGNKLKVRCIDCTKFFGNRCAVKSTKVTPKKKRLCGVYDFKGEYENRTDAEAVYIPHVDRKTRKMIKKLLKMGVIPVAEDGSIKTQEGFARTKEFPMPSSTATTVLTEVKAGEDPIIYRPESPEISSPKLIWSPGDDYESEEIGRAHV